MARVKLSEYKAKSILVGDSYRGVSVRVGEKTLWPKGGGPAPLEATGSLTGWVVKVDQGVKKRMKQGLVAVNVTVAEAKKRIEAWEKKGYTQFLLEPFVPHEARDERYISFERVREGIRVLYAREGGIDIEENPEKVGSYLLSGEKSVTNFTRESALPEKFVAHVIALFEKHFFAFLEINPLVILKGEVHLLDAALLVDDAGAFFTDLWSEDDVITARASHEAEERVQAVAKTTPASLKLQVVNENGALFFLLSGGGGSIVVVDEAYTEGHGKDIGNYGEYSGGPTREETYLYAREVIQLLLASRPPAHGKKALVIAGGVANFTDIKKTFAGIVDALTEEAPRLRAQKVRVFVRRGGPNEKEGLALMRTFLEKEGLLGAVYGSDTIITQAVDDAITTIRS